MTLDHIIRVILKEDMDSGPIRRALEIASVTSAEYLVTSEFKDLVNLETDRDDKGGVPSFC
jgi:hypothetical protein